MYKLYKEGNTLTRTILLFFVLIIHYPHIYGQMTYGLKINSGLGKEFAPALERYLNSEKNKDPLLKNLNAHSGLGGGVGVGVYIDYPISSRLSILSDISLNYQSSKLYFNYLRDSLNESFTGMQHKISSNVSIKTFYITVPLLARYRLWENKNYYIVSGFTLSFFPHPIAKASETEILTKYNTGIITSSEVSRITQKVSLDKFNVFNASFTAGMEKAGRRKLKNYVFGMTGSIGLLTSYMYTSNTAFYNNSFNSQLLSSRGVADAEKSGTSLKNFRTMNFSVYVRYKLNLSKKAKK